VLAGLGLKQVLYPASSFCDQDIKTFYYQSVTTALIRCFTMKYAIKFVIDFDQKCNLRNSRLKRVMVTVKGLKRCDVCDRIIATNNCFVMVKFAESV
jgi:hypothetical protein